MADSATEQRHGVPRTLLGTIPTLLVLAAIGAAGWWGHKHGWTVPKFSALSGPPAAADDWCRDHSVPESQGVECHPELLPKGTPKGWCAVHGVPECVLCNPELAQLKVTASVTPADLERSKRALAFAPRPENIKACNSHARRIQFTDDAAVSK